MFIERLRVYRRQDDIGIFLEIHARSQAWRWLRLLVKGFFELRAGAGAPRNNPSVFKSSSMSDQWIPYPPPAICQCRRCFAVALRSRGYQTNGTDIVRPSIRETIKLSSVNSTSATRSSAANAKVPMPRSEEHTSELQSPDHLVC